MYEYRKFGEFKCASETIQKYAQEYDNISVVNGFTFVPQNEDLFADLRLHPNDEGFEYYFEN